MVFKKVLFSRKLLLKIIFFWNKLLQSEMVPRSWKCFQFQKFLQECAAGSLYLPNLDALLYFIGISRNEVNALFKREGVK